MLLKHKATYLISMFIITGFLLHAQGLRVDPRTCISVESGSTLDISEGYLYLDSDATGTASIIDLGNISYTGGGEAKVERYLTNGKWHMISAPVTGMVAGIFDGDYMQYHDEETNDWTYITTSDFALEVATGYSLWSIEETPSTATFSGVTNTGWQCYNFTLNSDGFNLVGNPYPSVLDWEEVNIPANLSSAIWLFDPEEGENGNYKYYISGGGGSNTTTQYIPSGQGFFIRAVGGSGTLSFENDDRTHGGQLFYKSSISNQMIVLKVTGNNITTQTAIRFIPEATQDIDQMFDVTKIVSSSKDVPVVYSMCNGQKIATNTLPSIEGNEMIPVYFEAGLDGTYSFTATELHSLGEDVTVFLEDISSGYRQNLNSIPEYSFKYTAGVPKLFKILFEELIGIDELEKDINPFQCYINNGILTVDFMGGNIFEGYAVISIYNIAGQRLMQTESSQTKTEIPLNSSSAIYIIKIQYNQINHTVKAFNH